MTIPYQPEHYHAVTPYLMMQDADAAMAFYAKVFQAEQIVRLAGPDGKLMHAEIRIGDSILMMANGCDRMNMNTPQHYGGTTVSMVLYVPDVDAVVALAVAEGAEIIFPVKDQFYGDRSGTLKDPFGHIWTVSTHVEDPTPEQMQERLAAMHTA